MLHSLLDTLDRIAMNDDPIKFALVETSYQPFISLIRMLELTNQYPELAGIRMCSFCISAISTDVQV